MQVKTLWTDEDFAVMGWHDSEIYSFSPPDDNLKFTLDVDYIFKWILNDKTGLYSFMISPCTLTFSDVLHFKLSLDFGIVTCLSILDIDRTTKGLSPYGTGEIWHYIIETDKGIIEFDSSGYEQLVRAQPVHIESQTLGRIISPESGLYTP